MRTFLILNLGFVFVSLGCNNIEGQGAKGGIDTSTSDNLQHGDDCSTGSTCGQDLECSGAEDTYGTCQWEGSPGTKGEEEECVASWECAFGTSCSSDGVCREAGTPGTTAADGACEEDTDCQMLLRCEDGVCTGIQPPFWVGATCVEPDTGDEPLKVYFDIGRTSGEFYRLPFPNDMDLKGGHIDLTGHPNPGVLIEELGNPVDDYIDLIENDLEGFGTLSHVYFRFNRWPDETTMKNQESMYIVNLDPNAEKYKEKVSSRFHANSARGRYICHNWLALGPTLGRPLLPGTTYAAVLTNDLKDDSGNAAQGDDDFPAMLGDQAPENSGLAAAWEKFAPLRVYLKEEGIDPQTIVAATVFTTADPAVKFPKVREAVRATAAPTVSDFSNEGGSAYSVYAGKLAVPFYQKGTRPFSAVEDGGYVEYDANGLPTLVETEQVNFALTVPQGEAPEGGWPIIIYAHGTGGDERFFIDLIATPMTEIGAAVISMEQVQHGDRRGLSGAAADLETNDPKYLFYNFLNPRAARDNNVQAAADQFQLVRLIEDFSGITGESVQFDQERVYFFGHSQGTQGPFISAVHEPGIKGIILSGAGGNLMESLLAKKQPIDVATAMKVALMDMSVNRYHPLLNLVQLAFDSVDPVNHARYAFWYSMGEVEYPKRHIFMSYGIGDTYTPETTQHALAKSLTLAQWPVTGHELSAVSVLEELPHTQTHYFGQGVGVTTVVVQYEPSGDSDGHFVMFEHADAAKQSKEFIRTMITDGIPTLAAP